MSPIFWVDIIALGLAAIITTSMTLIAWGAGPRSALNSSFALFTLLGATWATFSLSARLALWSEKGNATTLAEWATLTYAVMFPLLLLFTAHYLNRYRRRTGLIVALGLAAVGILAVPLFDGRIVYHIRLETNGSTTLDLSSLGLVAALIPAGYLGRTLILFGQERRRLPEPYLAFSIVILVAGFIVGGVAQVAFPVLSLTNTLSVSILGYGVITRQLFNPLRTQTLALQREAAERTQAVEALRENQQRLELALKGADYALWDWDIPTGKVTRSERWSTMLGYQWDEVEPTIDAWRTRCHPDDLPAAETAIDTHFRQETPFYEAEYRIRTKSGEWIWIYDRGQVAERDSNGAPCRIIGIEQDVTARKHIEAALIRSERERRAILDSMSELVVYQNPQMEIVWTNRAAGQSVNKTPEQLVGHHCYEIWHQRGSPCESCPIVVTSSTGQSQEGEIGSPDGRFWFIRGYPVKDASGQIEGIVEVAQDVTVRAQAEQRQRDYVLERERANILYSFISSASHDLKTPLTTIKLSLHLMRAGDPETRERHVQILERQTTHLEQLLENMLNMTRLDANLGFKFELLDLNLLVQDIVDRHEDLARRKNQSLSFVGTPALPPVRMAKLHLAQAVNHLIVNALQYTPEAGQIEVRTGTQDHYAVIEVQDNGRGIAADDLPHIFEHFYRADKARSAAEGGTGLGLTIAKRVVETHQGRIEVESAPGRGSLFRVLLPLTHA
jgi:PAS domain S-box-containing protein